jgi:hypothetical protein
MVAARRAFEVENKHEMWNDNPDKFSSLWARFWPSDLGVPGAMSAPNPDPHPSSGAPIHDPPHTHKFMEGVLAGLRVFEGNWVHDYRSPSQHHRHHPPPAPQDAAAADILVGDEVAAVLLQRALQGLLHGCDPFRTVRPFKRYGCGGSERPHMHLKPANPHPNPTPNRGREAGFSVQQKIDREPPIASMLWGNLKRKHGDGPPLKKTPLPPSPPNLDRRIPDGTSIQSRPSAWRIPDGTRIQGTKHIHTHTA